MTIGDRLDKTFKDAEDFFRRIDKTTVGNNHWMWETKSIDQPSTYPPYNLYKPDPETNIQLFELALAGWSKDELKVYETSDSICIEGNKTEGSIDETRFHHRGIAKRNFKHTMKKKVPGSNIIEKVSFVNGMLVLHLDVSQEKPEKPTIVEIQD